MTANPENICKLRRLGRERQAHDLRNGHKRGLWFDAQAAQHVIDFIESFCRHVKGELRGQLIVLDEFDKEEIIKPLFGWMKLPKGVTAAKAEKMTRMERRKAGIVRRFQTAYIEVPRKGSKTTTWGAPFMLYLTLADLEGGGECYSAATKKDQAKIAHDIAKSMINQDKVLKKNLKVFRNNINCPALESKYEPVSADANTLDGLNPSGVLIDELHAHKDREVWEVFQTGVGARKQPLVLAITTAGGDKEGSICWEQHERAEKVLDGFNKRNGWKDDTFFTFISSADPEDVEHWDEEWVWEKANPRYGKSPSKEFMHKAAKGAAVSFAARNAFMRKNLNLWIGSENQWLDLTKWDLCGKLGDLPDLTGRKCYAGLDLASTEDFTAFVLCFKPEEDNEPWWILPRLWLPEDNVELIQKRCVVPIDQWIKDGYVFITPGNMVDQKAIIAQIRQDAKTYALQEIGFDIWNSLGLAAELQEYDDLPMVQMRQGYGLNAAMTQAEALVNSGKLGHGNNPVLRWMAECCQVKSNADEQIKPVKPDRNSSSKRIDGIVALIMAAARALGGESHDDGCIYSGGATLAIA